MASTALVAIFLPSFLLIWGTLPFWDRLRRSNPFRCALSGTNAAVVGLLGAALYNPVWTSSVSGWVDVAIVAVALAVLATRRVAPIFVVMACAAAGQLLAAGLSFYMQFSLVLVRYSAHREVST